MKKSKKISKFTRLISGITAVMLAVSCFGFDYDVFAANEPAVTTAPDYEYPPVMTDVSFFPGGTGITSVKTSSISLVEGTTTTVEIPSDTSGGTISCTSSDPSVATVNEQGVVTAYKAGTATLGYSFKSETKYADGSYSFYSFGHTINVTVTAATIEATGITVSQTSFEMVKGAAKSFSWTVQPANATDANVVWTSSDPNVAIYEKGSIWAKGVGTATITGRTSNGVTATVYVTVTALPEAIRISSNTMNLKKGESSSLTYTITPADTADNVTWSSSDTSVATVDNYGKVTAKKSGTAVITVKTSNGYTDTCTVTVTSEVESIQFTESNITLDIGKEKQLELIITPADVPNADVTLTVADPTIISINSNGKIKALKAGKTTITARTDNGKTATCTVTVNKAAPEKITVSPTSKTIYVGDTLSLTTQITPTEAADDKLTWSSNRTDIATVDANGKVTAKAAGTVSITVKTSNNKTATCTITVKDIEATGVTVNPTTATLEVGKTQTVTAKVAPDKADQSVTWTSSNTSVATVSSSGVVTAKAVGTTTITAKTANSKTATYTITVNPVTATSVTLSETSKELAQGATVTLRATIAPANATDKTVTWTSSNSGVATVDTNGKVTAKGAGTATITATTANGKTATCKITVAETAVTGVTFDKTTAQMNVDETMTLTATVAPANAGNKTLTWFSNNESVLAVDANGKVTAKGAGKATITAKSANGKIATCVITVVDPSSYKVEFTSQSVKMAVGSTMALEYKALPDGIVPEFEVVDEDIVSIDKNGNVTGLKAGNAVIETRVGKGEWTWIYVFVQPSSAEKEAAPQKFAEDVLYYVNIERAKEGLAPLQLMDELSYLAQIRTDEQAAVRTINHTRPDGTKWTTVFNEARTSIPKKASAENLIQTAGYNAEACVKTWMNSPGHRANILRANMTHMGVGVEFTNGTYQGAYIATQLFIQYNG